MTDVIERYVGEIEPLMKSGLATEHSYRPAVRDLLEAQSANLVAINEPKRVACGAPDFSLSKGAGRLVGHVECKDVGVDLAEIESSDQLARYRYSLPNLLLTNQIEFRWYIDGDLREHGSIGSLVSGSIKLNPSGVQRVKGILAHFAGRGPIGARSAEELATRLAQLARILGDVLFSSISQNIAPQLLDLLQACKETLLPDVTHEEFVDVFAQTLCYGLFAARIEHKPSMGPFTRFTSIFEVPKSNPFLRGLFEQLAGPAMEDEPYVGLVNDIASLLAETDVEKILADFGNDDVGKDPVLHFYETFLEKYNPELRERRGVYYTPMSVVEFIVRGVDGILKQKLGVADGLASSKKIAGQDSIHEVLVLDPACGTGTFLYEVLHQVREKFVASGNIGLWRTYAVEDLLPRLAGFELLMAPYALAHLKLGMELAALDLPEPARSQLSVKIPDSQRVRVYLTNTLDQSAVASPLPLGQWISTEANSATEIKSAAPVLVVLGNPPYEGHSRNNSPWIKSRIASYRRVDGAPMPERQLKWLNDDYVKFISFAEWRIAETGRGLVGFVVNHAFIQNPTFRGLRQSLLGTFDEIWVIDTHGSARLNQRKPADTNNDEPIFDIMQGTAILLMSKSGLASQACTVHFTEIWGSRSDKYEWLRSADLDSISWTSFQPAGPAYRFDPPPTQVDVATEWRTAVGVDEIFPHHKVGFVTSRDKLAVASTYDELAQRLQRIKNGIETAADLEDSYGVDRSVAEGITEHLKTQSDPTESIASCTFRAFDNRYVAYDSTMVGRPVLEVNRHLLTPGNAALVAPRQVSGTFRHSFVVDRPTNFNSIDTAGSRGAGQLFPLFLVPEDNGGQAGFAIGRVANLSREARAHISERLNLDVVAEEKDDRSSTSQIDVIDIAHYCYAVMNSEGYRSRYEQMFRDAYPRIPFASSVSLFWKLAQLGERLFELHLMRAIDLNSFSLSFPIPGPNIVAQGFPRFIPSGENDSRGRIEISPRRPRSAQTEQYFTGAAEDAWNYTIGGYQILKRYLADRRGRPLSSSELSDYMRIYDAVGKSLDVVAAIDLEIVSWPIP